MSTYPFLQDELAILEIRKHQWIESEKKGYEIGFATAALDWINNYGRAWQQFRLSLKNPQSILYEKRLHRRFNHKFLVRLQVNSTQITVHTEDVSLIGLSCKIPTYVSLNTPAQVFIGFQKNDTSHFEFQSRVARVSKSNGNKTAENYDIFMPFTEEVRDYIRFSATSFAKN